MVHQIGMDYGIWESLAHLAGNRLGGHEKVWVTGVYGLSQVWIKTEATVVSLYGYIDQHKALKTACYSKNKMTLMIEVAVQ